MLFGLGGGLCRPRGVFTRADAVNQSQKGSDQPRFHGRRPAGVEGLGERRASDDDRRRKIVHRPEGKNYQQVYAEHAAIGAAGVICRSARYDAHRY